MSIAKKILLALSLLVFGYSMTIAYGFITGGRTITKLNMLSSMEFPASQLSLKALKVFEEQIRLYQDMVATGDIRIMPRTVEKAEELGITLSMLTGYIQDPHIKKDVDRLIERTKAFNQAAPSVYMAMRKNTAELNQETIDKATRLAAEWKDIQSDLETIRDHFADEINTDLSAMVKRIRQQWIVNGLFFVFGVGSSLVIIVVIVMRFIRRPLQKTINAFATGAMGDFSERLDASAGDEFGQLAHYFNTFMEKLTIYNRDLHEEIKNHRISAENLQKSEELYTRLVNTIPEIVLRTDLDGTILYVNDFTEELLGFTRDELIGLNILSLVSPDEFDRVRQRLMDRKDGPTSNEYKVQKKDESTLFMDVCADVLRNEKHEPVGRVLVCRDITHRKLAEQERTRLQEQLIQSQKMESVGRLAGGVAHDFNNMLGVIIGNSEMALQDMDPSNKLHHTLSQILSAGERSADLTRQLLAFARKQTINPRLLNLNDIVASMLKMLQRLIGEDIGLVWMPGQHLWAVSADPSQIDQILANLVVNARDAIADTGKITIETSNAVYDEAYCKGHADCLPGEYVLLAVSDNGMGMKKNVIENIFEPFFTTKDNGKGTGLGLATVYGIVRQNQGFINVYSEPGQGTTFRVYLPRCMDESTLDDDEQGKAKIRGGDETVLVVEDETAVLNLSRGMIENLGYTVLTARTVDEALSISSEYEERIDLLLTDVVMPGMNGKDLARKITAARPDIKCLYMSGYTANVIAHHGILDKGVRFIAKPFSLRDLAARLRETLDGG